MVAAVMARKSEDVAITHIQTTDIGATNVTTAWLPMADFDRIYAHVILGTWNSSDDLDECKFEQATSSGGAGAKDLTTSSSGGNYDTANPVDALGDTVTLEARASDLDDAGGFTHVRLFLEEDDNTGVDQVTAVVMRHAARHPEKEKSAAAVTGSIVYVTPNS